MAVTARRSSSGRSGVGTTTLTAGVSAAMAAPAQVAVGQQQGPGRDGGEHAVAAAQLAPPLLVDPERDPAAAEAHRVAGQGVAGAELDPAVADEAELTGGHRPPREREHAGELPRRVAHQRLVPQQDAL